MPNLISDINSKIEELNKDLLKTNNEVMALKKQLLNIKYSQLDKEAVIKEFVGIDRDLCLLTIEKMHEVELLMLELYSKPTIDKINEIFKELDNEFWKKMGHEWYLENSYKLHEYFLMDLGIYSYEQFAGFAFMVADKFIADKGGFIFWFPSTARC